MWIRIGRVAALALVLGAGCSSDCVTADEVLTASVDAVGTAGATLGLPVARFDLTQHFISHTPYTACAQGPLQDVGTVELKITSTAATPLFMKFAIQGLNATGTPIWSHDDSVGVHIKPQQSVSVGQIAITPQRLDAGARVILTSVLVEP